jgi:hypothetical protein
MEQPRGNKGAKALTPCEELVVASFVEPMQCLAVTKLPEGEARNERYFGNSARIASMRPIEVADQSRGICCSPVTVAAAG